MNGQTSVLSPALSSCPLFGRAAFGEISGGKRLLIAQFPNAARAEVGGGDRKNLPKTIPVAVPHFAVHMIRVGKATWH